MFIRLLELSANCLLTTQTKTSLSAATCNQCSQAFVQPCRCNVVTGPSVFVPDSLNTPVRLNCSISTAQDATQLNPSNWRTANTNIPAGTPAQAAVYGGTAPRECRPFPDYDPRLSGVYNPSPTHSSCPECFLAGSGALAPPEYYNRSTWSTQHYKQVGVFACSMDDHRSCSSRV